VEYDEHGNLVRKRKTSSKTKVYPISTEEEQKYEEMKHMTESDDLGSKDERLRHPKKNISPTKTDRSG